MVCASHYSRHNLQQLNFHTFGYPFCDLLATTPQDLKYFSR